MSPARCEKKRSLWHRVHHGLIDTWRIPRSRAPSARSARRSTVVGTATSLPVSSRCTSGPAGSRGTVLVIDDDPDQLALRLRAVGLRGDSGESTRDISAALLATPVAVLADIAWKVIGTARPRRLLLEGGAASAECGTKMPFTTGLYAPVGAKALTKEQLDRFFQLRALGHESLTMAIHERSTNRLIAVGLRTTSSANSFTRRLRPGWRRSRPSSESISAGNWSALIASNAQPLAASSLHALDQRRGHCSDYHGFCAAMGRTAGLSNARDVRHQCLH